MGALPSGARGARAPKRRGGLAAGQLDVIWCLVWAVWRRLWKEDGITSVDALQASS